MKSKLIRFPSISVERGVKEDSINKKRVLIMSKDRSCIRRLDNTLSFSGLDRDYKLFIFDNINETILHAEEYNFDIIVIDYCVSPESSLTLLEYLSKVNTPTINTPKIVLTENFDQIENTERDALLDYANRVICKSAHYFDIQELLSDKYLNMA